MGRLFAGTPSTGRRLATAAGSWNRSAPARRSSSSRSALAPETQTARLKLEKRPKGKVVTLVFGLDPEGNDLESLAAKLKARCGTGGTVKDGSIELQGDHLAAAEAALKGIGYKIEAGMIREHRFICRASRTCQPRSPSMPSRPRPGRKCRGRLAP